MSVARVVVCAVCLCMPAGCAGRLTEGQYGGQVCVGVYDSRAIAIAFVGSPAYNATDGKRLAAMRAEYEKAKAAGDEERMAGQMSG